MNKIKSINEAIRILSRYPKKIKTSTPRSSDRYIRLLKFIRSNEGALASELSVMMQIKPASLSEMLSNLELDHLISRMKDESDRRKNRFYLTDKGHQHLLIFKHTQYDMFENILSPEEEKIFIELSQKMIDSMGKNNA